MLLDKQDNRGYSISSTSTNNDLWNTNRSWLQLKNYIFCFTFHLKVQKIFESFIELRQKDNIDMFSSPSSTTVTENIVANDINILSR